MSVRNFKEEFSNFLCRFTVPLNDANLANCTPLSYQEILSAVKDVINLKLNAGIANLNHSDVRTPAVGIIITTPDAPDIPKPCTEAENGNIPLTRFRSQDKISPEKMNTDSSIERSRLSDSSQSVTNNNNNNNYDETLTESVTDPKEEKKNAKSSRLSSNSLLRSNTYVWNNEFEDTFDNKILEGKDKFPEILIKDEANDFSMTHHSNVSKFCKKLNMLRDCANDMIKEIDEMEKSVPENTRPIRRLSAIGGFPGLGRASVAARTIQRPKLGRRSITTSPGTPTSSRLSPAKTDMPHAEKMSSITSIGNSRLSMPAAVRSASSGSLTLTKKKSPSSGRLSIAKVPTQIPPNSRSISSGALKLTKKSFKSPLQGSLLPTLKPSKTPIMRSSGFSLTNTTDETQVRPSKSPRFAHIQSTIPKFAPLLGKRKADEQF